MRVLYVSARFPWPPDRGDRLTGHALLRALAARHEVTLLSYVDGHEPPGALEALRALGIRVETVHLSRRRSWAQAWLGLLSSRPSQVAYYRSAALQQRARELVAEGADAVFVQLFRMAPAIEGLSHPARVLFLGDSLAMNLERSRRMRPFWLRPGIAWERRRVAAYEVEAARAFREAWVVSPVDRDDLHARGAHNVRLVPHGVDERLFAVEPARAPEPRLMFLGNLSVPHNVDAAVYAACEVLPRVRAVRPDATLWLVGAAPRPEVRALAELPGVTVTGALPDLGPALAAAHVMVAPLRFSSGIQNKVLEAMAAGLPVVTTSGVASGVPGSERLLRAADDAEGLAREVLALLADPAAATAQAERARAHARAHFSWDALARELERVVHEAQAR
ncbi:MAG: glycosyltransferase [bacterium]